MGMKEKTKENQVKEKENIIKILKEEKKKKPTVHQSKKKSLKLRLMSSRKCPHENAIAVCMLCEDIFAYKSSFEIYFRIKDTRTYIRRPTTLYSEKPSSWPICFIQKLSTLGLLYYLAYGLKNKVCSNSVYSRR